MLPTKRAVAGEVSASLFQERGQLQPDDCFVSRRISAQTSACIMGKHRIIKLHQNHTILGQDFAPALVIPPALFAARAAAGSRFAIPKWYGLGMLAFSVLDCEPDRSVKDINRQCAAPPMLTRIATQEGEPTLPASRES
jgi:hypothetical protein